MNRAIRGWALVLAAATSMLGGAGCSSKGGDVPTPSAETRGGDESIGTVGLDLVLASGAVINTVTYTISGPGGFSKAGSLDVSKSNTIKGLIAGLPGGDGYSIVLSTTTVDGATTCAGLATFKVVPRSTTTVMVQMRCHETPKTGSVLVNGTLNICPSVDGISVNPSQVFVGATVSLDGLAHDSDAGPAALSYAWTASSGSISDPKAKNPTFTCSEAGTSTVTLTVSDGDAKCNDTSSVKVDCVKPDDCTSYDSLMSALGELLADCRHTVDPRQFRIDASGAMVPTFDRCLDQSEPIFIQQLLSVQNKPRLFPTAKACIGGRFAKALDDFNASFVQTCPTWTLDHAVNPLTDAIIARIADQLPQPDPKTGIVTGTTPDNVLTALKFNHVYNVSFPTQPPPQRCEGSVNCAQACAAAFPTFVIGPVPNAAGQVETDAISWLDATLYNTFSVDRYWLKPTFYHPMALANGGAGTSNAVYNRYWSCNPKLDGANCGTGRPEPCSYNSMGSVFVVPMQVTCDDWTNAATCSAYCGGPLPPDLAPDPAAGRNPPSPVP